MTPPMVKCSGCGFNVEQRDVVTWGPESECPRSASRCSYHCTRDVREAYRRGFNEGLGAMSEVVEGAMSRAAGFGGLRRKCED